MFLWLGVVKVASLHAWTLTRLEFLLTNLELPHLQIKEANETNELHNISFHFPWNNIQVQCTSTTVCHRGKTFQNDLILYTMTSQAYHRLQNLAVWNSHFQCSIYTNWDIYTEKVHGSIYLPQKFFWEQKVWYFNFRRLMKAFLRVQKHLAKSWDPFITRLNLTF